MSTNKNQLGRVVSSGTLGGTSYQPFPFASPSHPFASLLARTALEAPLEAAGGHQVLSERLRLAARGDGFEAMGILGVAPVEAKITSGARIHDTPSSKHLSKPAGQEKLQEHLYKEGSCL